MKIQSTFRDIVIHSFLNWVNFGNICPFYFQGYGILFKTFKGKRDARDPFHGPNKVGVSVKPVLSGH